MKSAKVVAALLFISAMSLGMAACSDNDDSPASPDTPAAQAEYAILFYGYGGRSLDQAIMKNMEDFYGGRAESYSQVKIACQYRYSPIEDIKKFMLDDALKSGSITQEKAEKFDAMALQTIRFIVDSAVKNVDDDVLLNPKNIYGPKNCDIASADSLTNFINWAVKACPAKRYILILSDHGNGYLPHYDLPLAATAQTRGVLFDNADKPLMNFTAPSLKYAIGCASARMDVVYQDACMMNTMEYQFELKDVTDYLVHSIFEVPDLGGCYSVLIDELSQNAANLETALSNYNKACVERWGEEAAKMAAAGEKEYEWDYNDMTVTRTKDLDAFGSKVKVFVDRLVAAYADEDNKAKIDNVTKCAFKVCNECPAYDMMDYVQLIMMLLPDVYDTAFADELMKSFHNSVVSTYCSDFLMKNDWQVDCNVMLAVKGNYYYYDYDRSDPTILNGYRIFYADGKLEKYVTGKAEPEVSTWPSTLADTYQQLAFDKATGWSRWLYLNEGLPCEDSPAQRHYPVEE